MLGNFNGAFTQLGFIDFLPQASDTHPETLLSF